MSFTGCFNRLEFYHLCDGSEGWVESLSLNRREGRGNMSRFPAVKGVGQQDQDVALIASRISRSTFFAAFVILGYIFTVN